MSKINRTAVAENFVTTQDSISRGQLSVAFSNNPVEKAARTSLRETQIKLNALRLLVLTNSMTEDSFLVEYKPLQEKIEQLSKLIWPN